MRPNSLYLFLLLFLLMQEGIGWAQLDAGLVPATHIDYLRSVKQFGEFIDRFNQDTFELPTIDTSQSISLNRKKSILLLFNLDDPRLIPSQPSYSKEYVDLVMKFADEMAERQIYINRFSDQIKALVNASVLFKEKTDTICMILQQEIDSPNLVRWVISDVEADFLTIPGRDTGELRFLSPVSHELGFMELKRAFEEPEHLIDFIAEDFEYDKLSVFLKFVERTELKITGILEISYLIRGLGPYQISLSDNTIYQKQFGIRIMDLQKCK